MLPVTQVAEPCFEGGRVVFLNYGAVGYDGGVAGDGRPFAGRIEERDVGVRVRCDVVSLARFGVGVKD